ncbi:hypothetical protein BCS37_00570 [Selenomonas sp. oral taxon 920]|uniref:hypothetical protein n=1 Tax=Selenomonas sp. oral taxon 920 TaxID=1884263 RepID=UPI000840DF65|nr:hypothetical protein [Selenomonas sp. oral taxon 920]AOH47031.1 hypothetical protein BCS37_00570 [Selenomonas sp. oral taxon 920]
MQSKIIAALLMGAALTVASISPAAAAKLDAYRTMMENRSCTILYENLTPPERLHNSDKITLSMWAKEDMAAAPEYVSRAYRGVLVLSGADKYEERSYDDYAKSLLTKDGREFLFTRDLEKKKPVYYGNYGKGKVQGKREAVEDRLIYGERFGDADVTRLLSILLPPERKPQGAPRYEAVGAGTLTGGTSYEDYRRQDADELEAVRFYFDGTRLSRIASITYRTEGGKVHARKCILRIDRFDAVPDAAYLSLPQGLKEVK